MPHLNDPPRSLLSSCSTRRTLHGDVHSIFTRSRLGELKWVQPVDIEGNPLGVYETVDLKEQMAYSIMDGSCDAEEEVENQCGPSITSYCYDVDTQEREATPDEMVIHKYADPAVQKHLVALLALAEENHTSRPTNVPAY